VTLGVVEVIRVVGRGVRGSSIEPGKFEEGENIWFSALHVSIDNAESGADDQRTRTDAVTLT